MDQKTPLNAYIQRVLALKEERAADLSAEELRDVARELGLSERDLAAVEAAAEDHYLRGMGFLEHRRWGDAISELEEAAAVAPRQVDRLHALSRAYTGRWHELRQPDDRSRAELFARQCLELDPRHEASIQILNELDTAPVTGTAGFHNTRFVAMLVLTGLLGLGHAVYRVQQRHQEEAPPPVTQPEAESFEAVSDTSGSTSATSQEIDLPLTLDPGTTGAALELDLRQSRLQIYASGGSFYTLDGVVENLGSTELDEISVRLELMDEGGAIVAEDSFELLSSAAPIFRPRDTMPLHRLREMPPEARQARLVIDKITENPAASSYEASDLLLFQWRDGQPPNIDVELRQRAYRFSENTLKKDGSGYFDLSVEVENTGQTAIRGLKLAAEIEGGSWQQTADKHIVVSSGPTLQPGETWVKRFFTKVEGEPESFQLFVTDVK